MLRVVLRAAGAVLLLASVLCCGLYAPPASSAIIRPKPPKGSQLVVIEKSGVWVVECMKFPPPPKGSAYPAPGKGSSWNNPARLYKGMWLAANFPCHVQTEFNLQKNPLLPIKVGLLVAPRKEFIQLLAHFPPRFTLASVKGPTLRFGELSVTLEPFRNCMPDRCGATTRIPLAKLGQIEKAGSVVLVLPDLPGTKPTEVPVPVEGLSTALETQRKLALP
ncbi:MAG: invasion associated locus B family protein [Alphaproteobacteria bacterium]|nr:invasion associated locus B family protein [Alphaproteobacteria bacterium]